jgi:hypothetical protein
VIDANSGQVAATLFGRAMDEGDKAGPEMKGKNIDGAKLVSEARSLIAKYQK